MLKDTITIDGPAASGKTSVGAGLAETLHSQFIDSGSIYRALVWWFINEGIGANQAIINPLLENVVNGITINESGIAVFGYSATEHLHSDAVTQLTPEIGSWAQTRHQVRTLQRKLCSQSMTVITGRDVGSEVIPEARRKFYLTADPSIRAKRRFDQMRPNTITLENLERSIIARDKKDTDREESPMRIPMGASIINTDTLTLGATIELLYSLSN